eukprot:504016_1
MVSKTQISAFFVIFLTINAFIFQYSHITNFIDSAYWPQEVILIHNGDNHGYQIFTTNNSGLINNTTNEMCHYSPYVYIKANEKENKKTFRICLRGRHNHISDRIRKHGSWV